MAAHAEPPPYGHAYDVSASMVTFLCVLLFFHASEVALVCTYERASLSSRSLLLSNPYLVAMAFSLAEYCLSLAVVAPNAKRLMLYYLYYPGLAGVLWGELIRKVAWCTAKLSFSHEIRTMPVASHKLITHSIYAWSRHPAYVGWFIWAVSTQVLLANPLSIVCFACAALYFYKKRISFE